MYYSTVLISQKHFGLKSTQVISLEAGKLFDFTNLQKKKWNGSMEKGTQRSVVWLQKRAENKGLPKKDLWPVNIEAAEADRPEETERPGEQTGCSTEPSKMYSQWQAEAPPSLRTKSTMKSIWEKNAGQ